MKSERLKEILLDSKKTEPPRKLIDPSHIKCIDVLASKFKYYEACECWAGLTEALGELSVLMKYTQISMVVYLNDMK